MNKDNFDINTNNNKSTDQKNNSNNLMENSENDLPNNYTAQKQNTLSNDYPNNYPNNYPDNYSNNIPINYPDNNNNNQTINDNNNDNNNNSTHNPKSNPQVKFGIDINSEKPKNGINNKASANHKSQKFYYPKISPIKNSISQEDHNSKVQPNIDTTPEPKNETETELKVEPNIDSKTGPKNNQNTEFDIDKMESKLTELKAQQDEKLNKKIEEFATLFQNRKWTVFCFNFFNYTKMKDENGFTKLERTNLRATVSLHNTTHKLSVRRIHSSVLSIVSADESSLSRTMSVGEYKKKLEMELKIKLSQMKQIYLTHLYEKVPKEPFNLVLLADQIKCYMINENFALARFQGFSLTDATGKFFPTVLTDRPVNGPISSLFETVKSHSKIGKFDDDMITFNIEKMKTVTCEQKYSIICGLTYGICYIHDNFFIHGNLNPTTVYLDEHVRPVICDYVYIPTFKVETKPEKNECNGNTFKYFYEEKPPESIQNRNFFAPEVLNGDEFDASSDIYSLGLIILFILSEGEFRIVDGQIEYPENIGAEWKELINKCVSPEPSNRPKAISILKEYLLNEEKSEAFKKSVSLTSEKVVFSEKTELYLTLIKNSIQEYESNDDIPLEIFHTMIPNYIDIDEDTRMVITAAEKGDVKSIEKVGDLFYKGENNLHQDEEWACCCYEEAAKKGSLRSMLLAAKFNEEGIGTEVNFTKSGEFYKKALNKMTEDDPERPKIQSKYDEVLNLSRSMVVKIIQSNKTVNDIKVLLSNLKYEISPIEGENGERKVKLMFKTTCDVKKAKRKIEKEQRNYLIENSMNKSKESHRFDSLTSSLPRINLDDYYPGPNNATFIKLDEGATSETYIVYKKETNEKLVAKIFTNSISNEQINGLKREIIMASKFNHPSILKYIGFSEYSLVKHYNNEINDSNINVFNPTLLMKYIPGGNLEDRLSGLNNTSRLKIIIGIASGIAEMQKKSIVHRDLKPDNILLNEFDEPIICDLGSSRQYSDYEWLGMSDHVGTILFMAPELFNSEFKPIYKSEVDSYSFGIILYQILTGTSAKKIYPNNTSSYNKIMKFKLENYVPKLKGLNRVFKDLIRSCWNVSSIDRPDPIVIFETLIDAIEDDSAPLLPNVNMDDVRDYINKLP